MLSMRIAVMTEGPVTVTLSLIGKVCITGLGELRREIDRARRMQKQVAIDLSEVTLTDRPSLEFLAAVQTYDEVQLMNCPEYIEPWLDRVATGKERSA